MRSVTFLALVASALAVAAASAGNHDPTGVHLSFGDEEDRDGGDVVDRRNPPTRMCVTPRATPSPRRPRT